MGRSDCLICNNFAVKPAIVFKNIMGQFDCLIYNYFAKKFDR